MAVSAAQAGMPSLPPKSHCHMQLTPNQQSRDISPAMRDSPMADQLSAADVFLNRQNVILARSQRLIQSWLPPAPSSTVEQGTSQQHHDDGADFEGEDELAGIGSKRKAEDEGLPDGAFKRKKLASNDKLLEQLLGKKAANARKKTQEAERGAKHAAPKPLAARPKVEKTAEESDEEEGGRAAAFKSRKQKATVPPPQAAEVDAEDDGAAGEQSGIVEGSSSAALPTPADEAPTPAKKPKTGSYLDEILGQKAAKKKKSKKRKHQAEGLAT